MRDLAEAGEPERLIVRAIEQSRGRGRHSRDWVSPPGNLYFSMLLRPGLPIADCANLSLVAGLALRNAIAGCVSGMAVELKWPNDVLLNSRKVAGILTEGETDTRGMVRYLIVGCGVNLVSHPELSDRATTSLHDHGVSVVPLELLKSFALQFGDLQTTWAIEGFDAIKPLWIRHAFGVARNVTVKTGSQTVRGLFAGIDNVGNLRLMTHNGEERLVLAGELFIDTKTSGF